MIWQNLKNYFKCLKFYFVPLGIMSIFTVIGLYFGITGMINTVTNAFKQIGEIAKTAKIDWNAIWNTLLAQIQTIDFNQDINGVIGTVTSPNWITNALVNVAKSVFGESSVVEDVQNIIIYATGQVIGQFIFIFVMLILGFILGIFVVKLLVRKQLTSVKMWKVVLLSFVDALFWGLLAILFNYLASLASWVGIVLAIIFFLSFMFICLLEGYLFYGVKKISLKKVLAVKNVFKLYLIELIILAICAATTIISILIFNVVVGLYLAIPVIEISLSAISMCAEGYVVSLIGSENKKEKEKTPTIKNAKAQ